MIEAVREGIRRDWIEDMSYAAFTAYLMGAGGKEGQNFNDFLVAIHLKEPEQQAKPKSTRAKDAIKKAESILELARKQEARKGT